MATRDLAHQNALLGQLITPAFTFCCCRDALAAYSEALTYAPNNTVAQQRADYCKGKIERMSTTVL
jgi:hypothetical protein